VLVFQVFWLTHEELEMCTLADYIRGKKSGVSFQKIVVSNTAPVEEKNLKMAVLQQDKASFSICLAQLVQHAQRRSAKKRRPR